MIKFVTGNGIEIEVRLSSGSLEMMFPVYETAPAIAPAKLLEALGLDHVQNCELNAETKILLLEVEASGLLAQLTPDFNALHDSHDGINGVLVTSRGNDSRFDFHSRYFWPWSGGNEDPVTGATHTFLAKYWSTRLNKRLMRSYQSSQRTGWMEVELNDDLCELLIRGQAVVVMRGEFVI